MTFWTIKKITKKYVQFEIVQTNITQIKITLSFETERKTVIEKITYKEPYLSINWTSYLGEFE